MSQCSAHLVLPSDCLIADLKATFQLQILGVKKNPQSPMYTQLGVLTKGTVVEVNVSELGMVTTGGKVVFGKYAQITNNPENDGCVNAVLREFLISFSVTPRSCPLDDSRIALLMTLRAAVRCILDLCSQCNVVGGCFGTQPTRLALDPCRRPTRLHPTHTLHHQHQGHLVMPSPHSSASVHNSSGSSGIRANQPLYPLHQRKRRYVLHER